MLLKSKKYFLFSLFCIYLSLSLFSCTSTKGDVSFSNSKAVLEKQEDRMFWKISGIDKNGMPSFIYIQGTFHLADERCYPISDNVIRAFNEADRIFAEISTEGNNELNARMPEIYNESMVRANGRLLSDYITAEEVLFLKHLTGEELFDYCNSFEPWILTTILDSAVYTLNGFSTDFGLDLFFNRQASSLKKNIEGLDTVDCQIEALSFGTYEQQLYSLEASIENLKDIDKAKQDALEFYQTYLDGDTESLARISFAVPDESMSAEENEFYELYTQKLILDRNEKWANIFEQLLEEGGTTFVYAGTIHFIGDNSVFKYMEEDGALEIK